MSKMTFEQWWVEQHGWNWKANFSFSEMGCAKDAWEAATKAENERCVALCQEELDEWHGNSDAHAGVRCCISRIEGDYG